MGTSFEIPIVAPTGINHLADIQCRRAYCRLL